jgi:hypothetical protein
LQLLPVDAYTGSVGQRQSNPLAHSASQYQDHREDVYPTMGENDASEAHRNHFFFAQKVLKTVPFSA